MLRRALTLGFLITLGFVGGCSTNPATGKMQLNAFADKDTEIKLGSSAAPGMINEGGGEIPDPEIQAYVTNIGKRLAAGSERPDLPWEFHTLNTTVVNAFALPGGKVFITRGLMEKLENEAQVAGVLGHECGHVTAQHIGQQMTRQKMFEAGLAGVGLFAKNDLAQTVGGYGGQLYLLKFGRDQESQADSLGIRYMSKLNYDPQGQVQVMQVLKSLGNSGIEWLQTHPAPDTRIQRVKDEIKKHYANTQNNPQFSLKPEAYAPIKARLAQLPPAPSAQQQQAAPAPQNGGNSSLRR
jgi:predicted Zn-dependent protease